MTPNVVVITFLGAALVGLLAGQPPLWAAPEVLFESGRTQAIDPFMQRLRPRTRAQAEPAEAPPLTSGRYGLPVRTPSMTPGRVRPRALPMLHGKMAGARPLFLLGADRWSLQWLQQNRARLTELRAVGMVVAVARAEDLTTLRQAAGTLLLMPASAEALAQQLGLRHYPLLITPPGVIQQ